eukprot:TRINITY_DN1876_c1_g1_i1.p2 TRINITY_DN1876_c1_g1~~TRINITY_DN1876_c1_g1_i1.p2  ORF type:complete len:101 (-),score=27.68 TRINITY_DN1876_c1_g1_i1:151-453(-)
MDYLGYLYALLIAGGGIMGYIKAGSVMSLAMGMLFGTLAGLGAYRTSINSQQYVLGLVVSLAMFARFAQSFYQTGKVMPAGVVMVCSLVMVLRYGARAVL